MAKKYFWSLLTLMMVAMLSVGFVSCGDDDDEDNASIVGTWVGYSNGEYVTYQYNSDGTGTITVNDVSIRFTYSYNTETKRLTISYRGETAVFEIFTLTSTTLSGRNISTGGTMTFTRK